MWPVSCFPTDGTKSDFVLSVALTAHARVCLLAVPLKEPNARLGGRDSVLTDFIVTAVVGTLWHM